MHRAVTVGIVTWNSVQVIADAVAHVRMQTHEPLDLIIVDNASTDGTRERLFELTSSAERILLDRNTGFSAAHNLAIARTHSPFYLCLNPDVRAEPGYVATLVAAMARDPSIGSAAGKLLLASDPARIDSTGMVMRPSQRHLDRGQGELDMAQYDEPCLVFGVSAAAALYRRSMLEDVAVGGEVFDEDFFAYREDADLAWRAQLLGWQSLYVPDAVALHGRRVRPDTRWEVPPDLNRASVRNRFLLRLKNQTVSQCLRFAAPTLWRDLQVIGYILLRERSSLLGLAEVARLLPKIWRKRREILGRRRVPISQVSRWFHETSRPLVRPPLAGGQ